MPAAGAPAARGIHASGRRSPRSSCASIAASTLSLFRLAEASTSPAPLGIGDQPCDPECDRAPPLRGARIAADLRGQRLFAAHQLRHAD
jgi:hypothetical protein